MPVILKWLALLVLCACAAGCQAAIDPMAIEDAQTAVRVKTALVNDPTVGPLAIEVQVVRGVATLSGRVETVAQAEQAAALARGVFGVQGVQSLLRVGGEPPPAGDPVPAGGVRFQDPDEIQPTPNLLAVGGALGWSDPREGALLDRFSVSPLIKFGAPAGFGPAIAFGWFQAEFRSLAAQPQTLSRIHVKPVMAGVGYTYVTDTLSVSPSIVGGIAFNSLTITDTGAAAGVPVEVDNSFVWRPGVSVWLDLTNRFALNVSAGYVLTDLRVTLLEDGRLVKRTSNGDTSIVHAGLAYRLF